MSPQRLSSKVAVLQESALSAVEAAADAVIGEDDADDHDEDQNDLDTNHDRAKFSFIIILLSYKKYLIDIFLLIEIYLPIVSIWAVDRISSIIHCNSIYVKYSIFYVNIKFSIS